MSAYYVNPLSRWNIRVIALRFRREFGLENAVYFPIVQVLELLCFRCPELEFEIVELSELQNKHAHAETDTKEGFIRIRRDVYDGACNGEGRDRMTLAHEIGHFVLLNLCGVKLYRQFEGQDVEPYRDPEWQAKCFAGELLIAKHLVGGMGVDEAAYNCGVSRTAAEYQLSKFNEGR